MKMALRDISSLITKMSRNLVFILYGIMSPSFLKIRPFSPEPSKVILTPSETILINRWQILLKKCLCGIRLERIRNKILPSRKKSIAKSMIRDQTSLSVKNNSYAWLEHSL